MIDVAGVAFSLSDSVLENQEIESINKKVHSRPNNESISKKVNSRPKIEELFTQLVTEDQKPVNERDL